MGINDWRNGLANIMTFPAAKLVGYTLTTFYREGKECYPSITTLMEATGYKDRKTVIAAVEELKKLGLIKVVKGKVKSLSSQSNFYEFVGVTTSGVTSGVTGGVTSGVTSGINPPEISEISEISEIREVSEFKEKDTLKGIQKEKPENKKFIKPTLAEVQVYCRERQNNVDAERWLDYYEANGWKVGKNPMKDWRAAVRTWERGTVAGGGTNTEKRDENGLREIVW